jgi:hypothetical protein
MRSRMITSAARLAAALALAFCAPPARADDTDMQMRDLPWAEIGATARRFVDQESPDSVWPFRRESREALAAAPRKVIVHYMPSDPISLDNKPIDADHWAVHYMQRSGENSKNARFGGLARQRPMPAGPWPSPHSWQINAAIDVLRARLMGADAFGVDILALREGVGFWDAERSICAAASALAPDFHIVPEIDAYVFRNASVDDIVKVSAEFAACPAVYRLPDGRILYVPFAANNHPVEFWREVKDKLAARGIAIAFVPILQNLPVSVPTYLPISAGLSFWGGRDPHYVSSKAFQGMERRFAALAPQYWIQPIAQQSAEPTERGHTPTTPTCIYPSHRYPSHRL